MCFFFLFFCFAVVTNCWVGGGGANSHPFTVLSMALTITFFMKWFLVSLQSHDLKSTVLVAMFVDLDTPLFERGAYVC